MTELFLLGIIIGILIAGYVINKICFNWNLIDEVLKDAERKLWDDYLHSQMDER